MTFIETYGKEIVSLLIPFITWLLTRFLKDKVKLQVAIPHQYDFLVQEPLRDVDGKILSPTQSVKTSSFIIRNVGRIPATKVELVFNWKPMYLNLWPVRHYQDYIEPDNRYVLIFDSLAPDEALHIEVLTVNTELPNLITVRSTESNGKYINMHPQPVVGNGRRIFITILLALGMSAGVYLLLVLIQFLVLRTPFAQ